MSQNPGQFDLNSTEAAYIAGLIDGEGTVTLTRKHRYEHRQLAVTISSTERCLLEYVKESCGVGKITNKRRTESNHAPSFTYAVHNRQALTLLELVTPYLRTYKQYRARLILDRYLELTPRNGKYTAALLQKKSAFEHEVLSMKANSGHQRKEPGKSFL